MSSACMHINGWIADRRNTKRRITTWRPNRKKEKSIWEDEILERGHSLGPYIAFTAWHLDVYRFKQVLLIIMPLSSIIRWPS